MRNVMEQFSAKEIERTWRFASAGLIYALSVAAGLRACFLVISAGCVALGSWSLQGAVHNLVEGLAMLGALAALWATVLLRPTVLAKDNRTFVLIATGLFVLIVNCAAPSSMLRSSTLATLPEGELRMWVMGAALVVCVVNLARLIVARRELGQPEEPHIHRAIPAPHLRATFGLKPTKLQPFRLAVTNRTRVPANSQPS